MVSIDIPPAGVIQVYLGATQIPGKSIVIRRFADSAQRGSLTSCKSRVKRSNWEQNEGARV